MKMQVRCQWQCEQMKVRGGSGIGMYGLSVVLEETVPELRDKWCRGMRHSAAVLGVEPAYATEIDERQRLSEQETFKVFL